MLNLASFFHLNLMYSSISVEQRPDVIRKCYFPLLDLASSEQPLSLEATGLTLELIRKIDSTWIDKLKEKISDGSVEFIGSGYSQIIAPLVPGKVNRANLRLGMDVYESILGLRPEIWLVNEMAYSGGLPQLLCEAGIKALVMEWNNTWKEHQSWDPELRHHHQLALGSDGSTLPVIWVDTLDFQKFQRMAAEDIDLDEWVSLWSKRGDEAQGNTRFAAIYGSDAEVFDFRPGRYAQEGGLNETSDWQRIQSALEQLGRDENIKLNTLGAALGQSPSSVCGVALQLESTTQPVVVKKQEKYNLNRWAVTGRGDLQANTSCHKAASGLTDGSSDDQWRQLLWLWSSDFRTHITEGRWQEFLASNSQPAQPEIIIPVGEEESVSFAPGDRHLTLSTDCVSTTLDLRRGLAIRDLVFPDLGSASTLGTLAHGHFDDIAFGADFYSGHAVVQRPGERKLSDLMPCAPATTVTKLEDDSLLVRTQIVDGELTVTKEIELSSQRPEIILSGRLDLPNRRSGEIHPIHLTIIPGMFQTDSLHFSTHNGGLCPEKFPLTESSVHHGASYSTLVTAKGGLGATEGLVIIGDDHKCLRIQHDPCVSALIPTVRFEKVRGGEYFLRLRYSAQEIDETFVGSDAPWSVQWRVRIEGRKTEPA